MKFLLAVDGSEHSERATAYLAGYLPLLKDMPEVLLVNIHQPVASPRVRSYISKEALEKYYSEESDVALAPAIKILTERGVAFTPAKLVGDVGKEIAQYAKLQNCTMVVMGTHGHGSMGNLVMGSVATRVVAECSVPVLLIK